MSKCDECGITPAYEGGVFCVNCKPQTNADRLRVMSEEELAEFFAQQGYKQPVLWDDWLPLCNYAMGAKICHENGCKSCWLEWLRREAE